jgi:hypothetical protein
MVVAKKLRKYEGEIKINTYKISITVLVSFCMKLNNVFFVILRDIN